MRIFQLTPGTGHFYCGSCLRDAALATALGRAGHDAQIVPLYLPLHLEDGDPVPGGRVHMGGIKVFLQHKLPVLGRLPGLLADRLDRPGLLRWAAARGRMTDPAGLASLTLSMLRGEEGRSKAALAELASWLEDQPRPDVVLLSNAMLAGLARQVRAATGAPIVVTLQGEAPFLDALPEPQRAEAWSILAERARELDGFVAVSHWYGALMRERLGLSPEKVHVVHNGIDASEFAAVEYQPPGEPTVGYLARMCADKGLPQLVEAYLLLREELPQARLAVCGVQLAEDRPQVARLRQRLEDAGAGAAVTFQSNVDRATKLQFLRGISVLSVPATYGESFGLYLLEAMAAGVPVVQPYCAAFPEVLEATGGGLLVPSAEPRELARGLATLLGDPARARSLGQAGRAAVIERFSVERMAAKVGRVLAGVATQ